MSKYQRNVILLLISSLFLFPFLVPDTTTTLLPSEDHYIVIHIHSPDLVVESTNNASFTMSLSRLDSEGGLIDIPVTEEFQSSFKIRELTPGQYQIHLKSFDIALINISQSGVYQVSLLLLLFINAINLYSFAKKYYFVDF